MLAWAPESVRPVAVTVLPVPTPEEAKLPVPLQVTTSAPSTPVSVQLIVAAVVPLYALFGDVTLGATVAVVTLAVVVAVVDESE